jgi:DNA adenine methylase
MAAKKINTKAPRFKPPFGYFGSKHKLAIHLCENLPPHNAWVEAFCGSASLTLAKFPAPIEVINDLDKEIVNLFRQLRENQEALCKAVELTPYSREELSMARTKRKRMSDLERARIFLVSAMMAINGVFGEEQGGFSYSDSYSRHGKDARVNRWYNLSKRISEVVERLRQVRVENKDARQLLKHYINRPGTLVYLDPPYLANRTNGYNKDANNITFHKELLEIANKAKCMIFISGYNNVLYEKMLTDRNGWTTKRLQTTTRDSSGQIHKRTEVVWMNKQFIKAQNLKRVPIRLTKKERKSNKLNPIRQ